MGDNDKAFFGDGGDLQIYHDGSSSYVENQELVGLQFNDTLDTFEIKGHKW